MPVLASLPWASPFGFDVVASDASAGMVRRTQELAEENGVPLAAMTVAWDDLLDHFDPSTFELVVCVGNSLCHAEGTTGRVTALAAMARLLKPDGRLALTSRTWEVVRAGGTRIALGDRLVNRSGHEALVVYSWRLAQAWEREHHLEIAVAQVEPDGSVLTRSEQLSFWPCRYEELVAELHAAGLRIVESDFAPDAEGYRVIAGPADELS